MNEVNEHKRLARAFRTTTPSRSKENYENVDMLERIHTTTLNYPPDMETLSKIKYLRRYKSFIHEVLIFSKEKSSVIEIFESLIPRGCTVQFLQVEYKNDTDISTLNIDRLLSVSSVHIKLEKIYEDDIFRSMSSVKENTDFGIKLSGWHEFDDKYFMLVNETIGESRGIFNYDIGKSHVVFWSEEKY